MIKDEGVGRKALLRRDLASQAMANVVSAQKKQYVVCEQFEPPPDMVERVSELHSMPLLGTTQTQTRPGGVDGA